MKSRAVTIKEPRFLFLRDPLFLGCLVLYFVNRWILKVYIPSGFVHNHLNDLICVPFWVPIMLAGQRAVGLRKSNGPPLASEIAIPLLVWSWVFEVFLPEVDTRPGHTVADPNDVMYYALGALIAACFWRLWYRERGAV